MKTNLFLIVILLALNLSLRGQDLNGFPTLAAAQYAAAADTAFVQGNFAEAEKNAQLLQREMRSVGATDTPLYTLRQDQRGELLLQTGKRQAAIDLLTENAAAVIRHFGELSREYAENRSRLAAAVREDHKSYAAAVVHRREALTAAAGVYAEGDEDYMPYLALLAEDTRFSNAHDDALLLYQRLTELEKEHRGETPQYGYYLLKSGMVYADREKWEQALPKLKKGWKLYEPHCTDPSQYYLNQRFLFNAHFNSGDTEGALPYLRKMQEFVNSNPTVPPSFFALLLTDVANNYEMTGVPDTAYVYYQRAGIMMSDIFGEDHVRTITERYRLAKFNRDYGNYEEAIAGYQGVADWLEANPDQRELIQVYPEIGLFYTYADMSDYRRALEMYPAAIERSLKVYGPYQLITSEIHMTAANGLRETGQTEASKEMFLTWADSYAVYLDRVLRWFSENRQQKLLEAEDFINDFLLSFAFDSQDKRLIDKGFEIAVQRKNILFERLLERKELARSGNTRTADLWARRRATGEALSDYYSRPGGTDAPEFAALQQTFIEINDQIAAASAESFVQNNSDPAQLRNALPPRTAAVETVRFRYYPKNHQASDSVFYIAYLLRPNRDPQRVFLFEEKEPGSISATRHLYASAPDAVNWHTLLADKLLPLLTDIDTLCYAPTGLLHRVNWAAVPVDDKQTLSDRFALRLLPGIRGLLYDRRDRDIQNTALLYGGADYNASVQPEAAAADDMQTENESVEFIYSERALRGQAWDYLPWTLREAEKVAKILENEGFKTHLLTGKKATEASFKQIGKDSPSPRILHLATHGYFFPDPTESDTETEGIRSARHPLIRSGLIMAGANAAWTGERTEDDAEDGILTAYEISQMNLKNTELIVLSACDTGLGDLMGNEGVYGLQRAFKIAGAKYILMSLWSVDDKKTYEFMTRFYELYQEKGKSVQEAYQVAQNEMRARYAKPFNPRNWAGFVLVE